MVHEIDGYPMRWPADPEAWLTGRAAYGAWVTESAVGLSGHVALHEIGDEACQPAWATATGRRPQQLAEVTRLFVAPTARGLGLGRRLLDQATQTAHSLEAWPVLGVVADGRESAACLYLASGWHLVDRAPWSPGDGRELTLNCWVGPAPNQQEAR